MILMSTMNENHLPLNIFNERESTSRMLFFCEVFDKLLFLNDIKEIGKYKKTQNQEMKYMESNLNEILNHAVEIGASDIHFTTKLKPSIRYDGEVKQLEQFEILTPAMVMEYIKEIINEEQLAKYAVEKELDTSMTFGNVRFRIHIFKQSNADAIAVRIIPREIPKFKDLGMPPVIRKFTTLKNGLVLITGITGSGKSTTLASMIDEINSSYPKHIVTVEDPIEYIHNHKKSIVNQREIGTDVNSFDRAVRAAMREDPDVLLIGEMRDLETIQNAITMAETGHLVFGTLHTKSVAETIGRIIDIFPPEQQGQIRTQLASSIKGIISQNLLPKIGGGRVPSCEVMIVNDAIRSLIRENKNPNAIVDQIQMNSNKLGSQTLIQSLAKLVVEQKITLDTAKESIEEKDIQSLNQTIMSVSKK